MIEYLSARLKDAHETFKDNRTQKIVYEKHMRECPAIGEYCSTYSKLWQPDSIIKNELFDPDAHKVGYSMQFLDAPYIYKPTNQAYFFIYALAESDVDLSIFRLSSV